MELKSCNTFFILALLAFPAQSVTVRGRLVCGVHPALNTLIRLWDTNNKKDNPDDLIAEVFTGTDGSFEISGTSSKEKERQDLTMKIYHDCDDGVKPGRRKFKFLLPSKYAEDSTDPFEFGVLNLETRFRSNEERHFSKSRRIRRKQQEDKSDEDDHSPEDRIEPW